MEKEEQNKIYLRNEFDKFWKKIENEENFTLLRYGDGERAIMCGEQVTAQEGWESPSYLSDLGKALLTTLNINSDNFYYGISCPCCDSKSYYWYSSRIESKNITFANLWVNANYERFYSKFSNLKRDAIKSYIRGQLFDKIFSFKVSENKQHKILSILGIKIKFRRNIGEHL